MVYWTALGYIIKADKVSNNFSYRCYPTKAMGSLLLKKEASLFLLLIKSQIVCSSLDHREYMYAALLEQKNQSMDLKYLKKYIYI